MTFNKLPFPNNLSGVKAIPFIYKENSNIFLVIARKKNDNVMVYQAIVDDRGNLFDIEQYWLDLDPSYRVKSRSAGKTHDRDELSTLDYFAYGVEVVNKITPNKWEIKFNQHPRTMILEKHDKGVSLFSHETEVIKKIHHFFIHDRHIINLLPTVDFIDVVSFVVKDKKRVVDRIYS